jgi:hypothetical protein
MAKASTRADPRKPHEYVPPHDDSLAAVAAGGMRSRGGDLSGVVVTNAYLRDDTDRCQLPGCGRPRRDDIHALAAHD